MVKLQIVSDLHIEFTKSPARNWNKIIQPRAPYLCILGDLCPLNEKNRVRHFLQRVCPHFKKVFYVFGNHEFFSDNLNRSISSLSREFKVWAREAVPNLTVLDNKCVEVEGVVLVGATLWTYIPPEDEEEAVEARNDFRVIATDKRKWLTPKDTNRMHEESVKYIEQCVVAADEAKMPVVVLTHHAPLHEGTSDPVYEVDSSASTDLSYLFSPCIKLWAFGHTHYSCDFVYRSTRVYSNPRGYDEDSEAEHDDCFEWYDSTAVVEV